MNPPTQSATEPRRIHPPDSDRRAGQIDVDQAALAAFAHLASELLLRGQAYAVGQAAGLTPLELAADLGRPFRRLRQMADLAEIYGEPNTEEVECAAILGLARKTLDMRSIVATVNSEPRLLRFLAPTGAFARCVLAWQRMRDAGDSPLPEMVAYCIAADVGVQITKHSWPEISCSLAAAFKEDQLTMTQVEGIVGRYFGLQLTPDVAMEIARKAVQCVQNGQATASAEPNSPVQQAGEE